MRRLLECIFLYFVAGIHQTVLSWAPSTTATSNTAPPCLLRPFSLASRTIAADTSDASSDTATALESSSSKLDVQTIFEDFLDFLLHKQREIIDTIETMDGSVSKFSNDTWGLFNDEEYQQHNAVSGGITRVLQGGNVVEKGACSLTLIRRGVLSVERAMAIRSRQQQQQQQQPESTNNNNDSKGSISPKISANVQAGDAYSAAALSIVFHSRSPLIPTFRSDVRIFLVECSNTKETIAFFGGGADLTPYYLYDDDITLFHQIYHDLCKKCQEACGNTKDAELFSYPILKRQCDDYFYLPARAEHRGTGGIFFDDMPASNPGVVDFVRAVADAWIPSWFPIIEKRRKISFTDQQKQWQLLRRGRYLEFNLLYDRGVKFGLANTPNPRVEGVMVSAPPVMAFEYQHRVEPGSDEDRMMQVLKSPKDWIV